MVLIQLILHYRRHSIGHQHSFHKSLSVVFYNFAIKTKNKKTKRFRANMVLPVSRNFFLAYFTSFKHSGVINCDNYRRIFKNTIFKFDLLLVCGVTKQKNRESQLFIQYIENACFYKAVVSRNKGFEGKIYFQYSDQWLSLHSDTTRDYR